MAITLQSDYKDAPSFIKNEIEDNVQEKYGVLFIFSTELTSENPETLRLLRKEYRRYRRHWRRLDIRQQIRQRIGREQRILNNDLSW